jgi:hypothetical protein
MGWTQIIGLGLLWFTSPCAVFPAAALPQPRLPDGLPRLSEDRRVEEDNIREAVFRYRIELEKSKRRVFLSIDGKDPGDDFMARFAALKPPAKKASGAYFKKEPFPGWLLDRSTDKRAVHLSVSSIKGLSEERVEVQGGSYCGGLCADAGVYLLVKKDGRWTVERYKVVVVS